MNHELNTFQKVLQKFKFVEPIPAAKQIYAIQNARPLLVRTLKKVNNYNFFYGQALFIFFQIRKFGLKLSIGQAKVFLMVMAIVILAAVGGAIYLGTKYLTEDTSAKPPAKAISGVIGHKETEGPGLIKDKNARSKSAEKP
jgi:hypothetical protein